jgi:hypothetical protein
METLSSNGLARFAIHASWEDLPKNGFALAEAVVEQAGKASQGAQLLADAASVGWNVHTITVGGAHNSIWVVADKLFSSAKEAALELQALGADYIKMAFFTSGSTDDSMDRDVSLVTPGSISKIRSRTTMLTPQGIIITS